ncbi:hypothetical protein FYJ61_07120 [Lactobacillus equicursoris]|uniref:Uncharacterized protein n=1 Tax=Lactobacillus equicursoris TaxID=420645 RepID=A0A844FPR2_9LACO|nr:hypothetical protein [Lactobacillus equicursoris]MST80223.1 hypothetical protein [Lactobacillus equicursoris]
MTGGCDYHVRGRRRLWLPCQGATVAVPAMSGGRQGPWLPCQGAAMVVATMSGGTVTVKMVVATMPGGDSGHGYHAGGHHSL